MIATRILPESFVLRREINLQKDQALFIKLNIWGLALLPIIGYVLLQLGVLLHPGFHSLGEVILPQLPLFSQFIMLILGVIVITVLHELVHGIFFWIITRQIPRFGFRGAYAFAAAPEWYIARGAYLWIGIAPLVVITVIGIICIPLIPAAFLFTWLFCLLTNASGAIGDIYVVAYLLSQPASALIQDHGDMISIYSGTAG